VPGDVELLLVILRDHGKIAGRKRFQKIVFLLQRKYNVNIKYKFIPYLFGPYSKALQTDINLLSFLGLTSVRPTMPYLHTLTPKGLQKAWEIEQKMNKDELKKILCAVKEMKELSTDTMTKMAKSIM